MSLPDSSIVVSGNNAPAAPLPQHDWDLTGRVPDKPAGLGYGYVVNGQTISSTREQLIELILHGRPDVTLVWTPETPEPVRPEQVAFLIDSFRRIEVREARKAIWWGSAFVVFGVLLALGFQDWKMLYRNLFSVLGAVAVTEGIWKWIALGLTTLFALRCEHDETVR